MSSQATRLPLQRRGSAKKREKSLPKFSHPLKPPGNNTEKIVKSIDAFLALRYKRRLTHQLMKRDANCTNRRESYKFHS
jgi:hypothetical protein